MGLFDMTIDQVASHGAAASVDTTMLYHQMMATVYGFDIPNDPPPSQAMDASHFTIDGIYIYLTYVCSQHSTSVLVRSPADTFFRLQIATILL
jgi:hypothetical protein